MRPHHTLDQHPETVARVAVVGSGVAGMVAAWCAADRGAEVVLVDPHPPGGRAQVDHRNGFTFNRGPRALYWRGPARRTLRSLGIELRGGRPATDGAAALAGGELHPLPTGLATLARTTLLASGERRMVARLLAGAARATAPADQSLAGWLDARSAAGRPRELVEALVRLATYADVPEELPASVALRAVRNASSTGVRYLDGGFATIVDQLRRGLAERSVTVLTDRVDQVAPLGAGFALVTSGGELRTDAVVLASGGPATAARLLGGLPRSWPQLGPPARAACLELGVARVPERRFVVGIDEPLYLSVHSPPARLAPEGSAVVHVMRYRSPGDSLGHAETRDRLEALAAQAGIVPADIVEQRYLHDLEVTGALPTVHAGGMTARVPVAVGELPGAFLAGDWVGAEGLLVDAAVASAASAGRQAAAWRGAVVR
jgi:phytoene dehydrogenase-like protein